ncbi:hypothetical protein [Rhodococcus sp. 14-2470-1a]|uniref:hypothetical protein n=1 Tax=Rhodococcus sp. 14-2470-1a TaxID=2023150 RepID=UPI000B9C462B|nr:hypothetical protein [Rhodococcus sp. 14-2470-1a]OZF42113.1 hypothetical protein CH292_26850 [Rhodococcus sp. 14-2470-1a]
MNQSEDNRSFLERIHARWFGPLFAIVGVIAAVFGIAAGVRACTSESAPTADTSDEQFAPSRLYEGSSVGRGWGPERDLFTVNGPSPLGALNSITDNPAIGDERNYTRCKLAADDNSFYENVVSAADGDVVRVYVNLENASIRPTAAVIDTRMRLLLDMNLTDDPGIQVMFTGTRESDGTKQEVWDGCGVNSNQPLRLVLVPGSGEATTLSGSFDVADEVIIGSALIPAVPDVSEEGVVPGSTSSWGYFTFDLLAVGEVS